MIRTYRAEDAQALCGHRRLYQHLSRYMPWANTTQTIEETEAIIQSFSSEYADVKNFVVGIWREADGALLGGTGFHLREGPIHYASAEIGMWIAEAYAGQGIGKRALKQVLRWGFTEWPWFRLAWRCNADNIASIRCAEANGLLREGTLRGQYNPVDGTRRDTASFAILREEWLAHAHT